MTIVPEHVPLPFRMALSLDDACYSLGLPHTLDVLGAAAPAAVVAVLLARRAKRVSARSRARRVLLFQKHAL